MGKIGKIFLRDGGLGKIGSFGFERFLRFLVRFIPKSARNIPEMHGFFIHKSYPHS